MSAVQVLNDMSQLFQHSFASLLKECQQSTLWIGNTGEMAIAAITIQETQTEAVLKAHIPEVQTATLNVQVSQETVLIQGQWSKSSEVEGFFRPRGFQSLIPLPYSVHPETVRAELEQDVLTVRFRKQGEIQPSRVRVELKQPNLVIPQLRSPSIKINNRTTCS